MLNEPVALTLKEMTPVVRQQVRHLVDTIINKNLKWELRGRFLFSETTSLNVINELGAKKRQDTVTQFALSVVPGVTKKENGEEQSYVKAVELFFRHYRPSNDDQVVSQEGKNLDNVTSLENVSPETEERSAKTDWTGVYLRGCSNFDKLVKNVLDRHGDDVEMMLKTSVKLIKKQHGLGAVRSRHRRSP